MLVTGSRDWDDIETIARALVEVDVECRGNVTLISGACPTGADHLAEVYAHMYGWRIERYPADWEKYGKRAGFIRNSDMVENQAPDLCIAFIKDNSKGATMTLELARKKGIETVLHEYKKVKCA